MRILHTADIHLKEYGDERWEALRKLIEVGRQNEVEIFTICGDLFDTGIDAEKLRPKIREVFSNTGFKLLVIPGNHDIDSYRTNMYFGDDVLVLDNSPFEYGNVRIVGMPFEAIQGQELLKRVQALKDILTPNKKNILLCHGELLDAFFSRTDFGAEGEGRYMPFKLSYFEGLNIDYVLAGHFHSKFDIWKLKDGGYFVYPGSPISITKSETGLRKVNIFEIGEPPREYVVDTPHYEEVTIELTPFKDEKPLEIIKRELGALHPKARAILTIQGYINSGEIQMLELDLVALLKEIAKGKCAEEHYEFRDISRILENDLFKSFINKVREVGYSDEKINQLQDITMQAMMKAEL